jgi:hypothetical protein
LIIFENDNNLPKHCYLNGGHLLLDELFEEFINDLEIKNLEDIFKRITKRLNTSFWDSESDKENSYI